MLAPRTAWGLDIGESSIKAVKIRRTKVGAEVLAFDMVERGIPAEEGGDKDYQLRTAVNTLVERNNLRGAPVVVSIPEPAFSRFIPLPPVDRRRIPEVVRYEARQQIPFPIEEVVWDYMPVRETIEAAEETEVAIFSLRSQFVYALLTNLALCKIQPVAVLPVPLALFNYLTFDRDVAKGTIVIDLGAGSTDILICDPENFRVRNISISGNGITRALAERLKIQVPEAEKLKRECKDKVQAERLFKLIQPTLNDLVGQVQRTIGFFKSQIHNVRIEQALLLGNTFRLPGVTDFFINQLGCDLIPSNQLERVTLASNVDGAAFKEALPSLGVALGLALQGVELGRVRVNLMPQERLFRQQLARKRPYAIVGVACLALLMGTYYVDLQRKKEQLDRDINTQDKSRTFVDSTGSVEKRYAEQKRLVDAAFQELDKPGKQMVGLRDCLAATNALNQILTRMSKDVELTQLRVEPGPDATTTDLGGATLDRSKSYHRLVRIAVAGRTANPNVKILQSETEAPLKAERAFPDGTRRPQFVNVKLQPTALATGVGIEFILSADYLSEE